MVCFARADGWHYCYHDGDVRYKDIAVVKLSGRIVWNMKKEDIDNETLKKILQTSEKQQKVLQSYRETLENLKENIKCVPEKTKEYFIILHSINWYRREIEIFNLN